MALFQNLSIFTFLLLTLAFPFVKAATIDVLNNCDFTVWAAAVPGGGRKLDRGQTWSINVNSSTGAARIWARTNCKFDGAGRGNCQTGDCGGVLQCTAYGQSSKTLAEYSLNQLNNLDSFAISRVDGFNVPMEFGPTSNGCSEGIKCVSSINIGQPPSGLQPPGGCNICYFFQTDQYCCVYGSANDGTLTCPGGTNYKVVFCPVVYEENTSALPMAQMHIQNNCSYTVWAAANPFGGRQLNQGETWTLNVTGQGRIWGRTNCDFDEYERGKCDSGDCDGLLECKTVGRAPHTLAQYSIGQDNLMDYLYISLLDGFNVPMEFSPTNTSPKFETCRRIKCAADINEPCPMELRDSGGCNNPCTVFRNDQFCCYSSICEPTNYSRFFKQLCPDAYSYPLDEATSIFCPTGSSDYNIIFCP